MYCPNCGHYQYCGCDSCRERNIKKYDPLIPYVWIDGELVMCGKCGLMAFPEWWGNLAILIDQQFEEKERYFLARHNYQVTGRNDLVKEFTKL